MVTLGLGFTMWIWGDTIQSLTNFRKKMLKPHAKADAAGPGPHLQNPWHEGTKKKEFPWKSSTDEDPKQLREGKSFALEDRKNLLSIYPCARPCAKASDALVHLILVTPITGMEMKKS